MSLTTKVISLH